MRTVLAARASTILYRIALASPAGVFLLPANICPIVPLTLMLAARPFEFVDLDPESLAMSPELLGRRLADTSRPRIVAIVYVRTYGAMADVGDLFSEIQRSGAVVIDDRCLTRPEPDPGALDCQGADAVLFSTGTSKPIDLGFGGFAYLGERMSYCDAIRAYEAKDLGRITDLYKSHIESRSPIPRHARADLQNLRWLDTEDPSEPWPEYQRRIVELLPGIELHRQRMNDIYEHYLDESLHLGPVYNGWRFQVRLTARDVVLRAIFEAGYFASTHYFPSSLLFSDDNSPYPVATALASEVLNLFNDSNVDERGAETVARIVASHFDRERSTS